MKKKEILIIFVLAVLVAGGSWFRVDRPFTLDASVTRRGWPLAYWSRTTATFDFGSGHMPSFPPRWSYLSAVVDSLFWFLVLAAGWWVVERIRRW